MLQKSLGLPSVKLGNQAPYDLASLRPRGATFLLQLFEEGGMAGGFRLVSWRSIFKKFVWRLLKRECHLSPARGSRGSRRLFKTSSISPSSSDCKKA